MCRYEDEDEEEEEEEEEDAHRMEPPSTAAVKAQREDLVNRLGLVGGEDSSPGTRARKLGKETVEVDATYGLVLDSLKLLRLKDLPEYRDIMTLADATTKAENLIQELESDESHTPNRDSHLDPPSDAATPTHHQASVALSSHSIGPHALNRDAVLRRDSYTCLVSGNPDAKHPVAPGILTLQASHIVKRAVMKFDPKKPNALDPTSTTFDILRNYTRLPSNYMDDLQSWVDHPSNALLLDSLMHELFDKYLFCLRPDPNDSQLSSPGLPSFVKSNRALNNLITTPPYYVIITNHGGPSVNLPDPIFIGIHATVAGVLNMSGADRFFDEVLRRYPPLPNGVPPLTWEQLERHVNVHVVVNTFLQLSVSSTPTPTPA
ncbi:hypothetical protein NLJ89_g3621 [Agrocybe chaxingu]|uniref:HNH nuclease domain-containing protein n=1 Tax=Agrocybe chaxingu TaxID=84603 RepID=A0A9W8MVB2_9AGAR|nr:hypothetical protein NLJ89_g3621 [Agrocybe chaxingu]